jgi:hypothetical protein
MPIAFALGRQMEWTGIAREDLEELISSGLEAMDEAVQDAWRRMRIEPEKWRCSPWGDQGGGFWVVAEMDGRVVWYNDIEEGFNIGRFDTRGTINEYTCNQTTFEEFLLGLPEASAAELWDGSVAANVCPPELQNGGSIVRRQTTYWDLCCSTGGALWRVHFRSKVETRYAGPRFSSIEIVDAHPFLDQYLEPWAQLFFAGTPINPEALKAILSDRVAGASAGWRNLEEYINAGADLGKGYGLLMRAPTTIVNLAVAAISEMGLSASVLHGGGSTTRPRALIMEKNAVVAQEFRFEPRDAV